MSDKDFKEIRKQLRNVFKEVAPELLKHETINAWHKELQSTIKSHLDAISKNVQSKMKDLDERSKEMQAYIIRNVALPTQNPTVPQEEPNREQS